MARFGRISLRIILLSLLSALASAAMQEGDIQISLSNQNRLEGLPGSILTVGMFLRNSTVQRVTVEADLQLPEGWRAIAAERAFELLPGAGDLKLLSVSIPASTPAGVYELRYSVRDNASPPHLTELRVPITVTTVRRLELRLVELPRYARTGEPIRATFSITNRGNASVEVRLSATNDPGAALDSTLVHLAARESRTFHLLTITRSGSGTQEVLEVTALNIHDSTSTASVTGAIKVIPSTESPGGKVQTVPLLAKARVAGEGRRSGGQFEIAGGGALDESGTSQLDLLLRTPDIQPQSILGPRDEYRLAYRDPKYEAYLGDKNFILSPLTEYSRYAFGAGGQALLGDMAVGGFYNKARFSSASQKEAAGFVQYRPDRLTSFGVNYLHKSERLESNVFSLRGIFQPYRDTETELEYGVGRKGGTNDEAYAARISGRETWGAYEARYLRAGSNYPGYYSNVDFKTANIMFMPLPRLRVEGYIRDEQSNLARDTSLFYAPHDRYLQAGFGYGDFLTVYYKGTIQEDVLPVPKYQRTENAVILRTGVSTSALSVFGNFEAGSTHDRLAGTISPFRKLSLFANTRPFEGQSYGVSGEYSKEQALFSGELLERFSGSITASLTLIERTMILAGLYGSRSVGTPAQTYSMADLSIEHRFRFGHTLTVRGRQSIFTPANDSKVLSYLVEYAVPIGIPLGRTTTGGRLSGRLIDSETGRGIPNVAVTADGGTTVTESDGSFMFGPLRSDTLYLQLDMSSVGLDRVALQPMPMQVVRSPGEEPFVGIGIVRAVGVNGGVTTYDFASEADTAAANLKVRGAQSGVVVQALRGEEIQYRVSDARGRFSFSGLRPGLWKFRVADVELPELHYVERDTFSLELKPGEQGTIQIRILPRKRKIQIIQEGRIDAPVVPPKRQKIEVPSIQQHSVRPDCTKQGFVILLSSWTTEKRANDEAVLVRTFSGKDVSVHKKVVGNSPPTFEVRMGMFDSRPRAEAFFRRFEEAVKARQPIK